MTNLTQGRSFSSNRVTAQPNLPPSPIDPTTKVPEYLANHSRIITSQPASETESWFRECSNTTETNTPFPTHFTSKDKHKNIQVSGTRISYIGPGKSDSDAATVRSNCSIPIESGIFYYEINVVSKGRDGYISVGFCDKNVNLNRLPGWDPHSWGYHGDDGHSFCCSGTGKDYGPSYTTGDIVGVGINFFDNTGFFTKNGVFLGTAFRDIKPDFYCAVGMRTPGEVLEANFTGPFKFDIDSFFKAQKSKLWKDITEIGTDSDIINGIVLKFLVNNGYSETANQFQSDTLEQKKRLGRPAELDATLQKLEPRKTIVEAIINGNISAALSHLKTNYPQLDPDVHFQLKVLEFISCFENGDTMSVDIKREKLAHPNILEMGQALWREYGNDLRPQVQDALQDVFSLVAYQDPNACPNSFLFSKAVRERVASVVNKAILAKEGVSFDPIEAIWKQTSVLCDYMCQEHIGAGAMLDNQGF